MAASKKTVARFGAKPEGVGKEPTFAEKVKAAQADEARKQMEALGVQKKKAPGPKLVPNPPLNILNQQAREVDRKLREDEDAMTARVVEATKTAMRGTKPLRAPR